MQVSPTLLELPNLVEVKCLRVNKPRYNYDSLPLSGIYNDIHNEEDPNVFPLENKIKNFDLAEKENIGIENMLTIFPKFGKVLFYEYLEAILIFINTSDKELKLKNLKIALTNEQNSKEKNQKTINFPIFDDKNIISIQGKQYFSIKFKVLIDTFSKYSIDITMQCLSQIYNETYERESRTKTIGISSTHYQITNNIVHKLFNKHLTFETVKPFKVEAKFNSIQMKKCQIEVKIANQSSMPLMVYDISLFPGKNEKLEFKSINSSKNQNFLMENQDEKNLIFLIDNPEIFTQNDQYYCIISWANMFDSTPKFYKVEILNKLNIVSKDFSLSVLEQPSETIIQNQSFKIIFQLTNKTKKLMKVNVLALKYEVDKPGDREFDVIDIVDNNFELKDKANFCLICKCDILGTVCLPKLVISVNDAKANYDKLLYFNCVPEPTLM